MQRHPHAIAGIDGCGIANDVRPVRIPADGITASQHRQRAEAVEARDRGSQTGVVPTMEAHFETLFGLYAQQIGQARNVAA